MMLRFRNFASHSFSTRHLLFAASLVIVLISASSTFGEDQQQPAPLPAGAIVVGKEQWVVERPLPAFTLYTADDQPVPAQTLIQSGYWLVIYRDWKCSQCDALMQMLSQHTQDASHIVFVVSNITGSNLLLLQQQYPDLAEARWLREVKSNFSTSMNISGTPHVIGMHNGGIRWQRAGVSAADTTFPAAIDGWLKYNLLPPNKFVRTPLKNPADQKPAASSGPTQSGEQK